MDPSWSRLVTVPGIDKVGRTWHLLDSWATNANETAAPELTVLCVHGNPSWSFLWRELLSRLPSHYRVIAVDQLDMGFSERSGLKRTLTTRIDDLCQLTDYLEINGPVVTVAHDWGGPVSLGWAHRHRAMLKGIVLTNTAVHQPEHAAAPAVIRLIRNTPLLKLVTARTQAFIHGAVKMSRPALSAQVAAGFHAPYRQAWQRSAITDFVEDIPLQEEHESASALKDIADGLANYAQIPALLLWGPRDKVFSDIYLHDLEKRLPHASVHRFPNAAHFVSEDADVSGAISTWLSALMPTKSQPEPVLFKDSALFNDAGATPTDSIALADFSACNPDAYAVVEPGEQGSSVTFGELSQQVESLAAGLLAMGIKPGQRVAVMIMPGIDLSRTVYACWRAGVALVLVDSGLGRKGMQGALRSANPDYLIGIDKALLAARVLSWPGQRISLTPLPNRRRRFLRVVNDLDSLASKGASAPAPDWPAQDAIAAVVFTSGSTGPSKGVIYQHRQVQAQRDALAKQYSIGNDDRMVAAFAPFALYGPALGITSIVPTMDVTRPGTLTAKSLVQSIAQIDATLVFASPAALVNINKTKSDIDAGNKPALDAVRLVLSAGAPVRQQLLEAAGDVFPQASLHTPYGMTEVLPVADISLEELKAIDPGNNEMAGVCVGHPLAGVEIVIDPLARNGMPCGQYTTAPDVMGEIIVHAAHSRYHYDRLWHTDYLASIPAGAHRSGDVGQLDSTGRLWVGGRLQHVISSPAGPVAPVAAEQCIETLAEVEMAALVGVGPPGVQAIVAVVQQSARRVRHHGAELALIDRVRQSVGNSLDIAAVLTTQRLPVDSRHNSKVDRTAVAVWAERVLAGEKAAPL